MLSSPEPSTWYCGSNNILCWRALNASGMSLKKEGVEIALSLNNRMPGSPPCNAPPGSSWYFVTDCTEFHPGAQKKGIAEEGGSPLYPSIVNESGESLSCSGFGSLTRK